jgi:hypothetical protein
VSRRIITSQLQATTGAPVDGFFDKVIKNIPSDVVAGWLCIAGLIDVAPNVPKTQLLWGVGAFLLVFTFVWTLRQTQVPGLPPARTQALLATGSFGVWVFAVGGPFAEYDFYEPVYGSILLVLYTLIAGLVVPSEG